MQNNIAGKSKHYESLSFADHIHHMQIYLNNINNCIISE